MYKNTVTVFNRKPGDRGKGATWYPTIIENCNLNVDRAAILAKYGAESKDSAYVGIHYQKKDGVINIAGKRLLEPKEWDGNEDSITFSPTGDFSGMVNGMVALWRIPTNVGRMKDFTPT